MKASSLKLTQILALSLLIQIPFTAPALADDCQGISCTTTTANSGSSGGESEIVGTAQTGAGETFTVLGAQRCSGGDLTPGDCQSSILSNATVPDPSVSPGIRLNGTINNTLFDNFTSTCAFVDNNGTNDYFVPQATDTEFNSFVTNHPSDTLIANCAMPIPAMTSPFVATASVGYPSFQIFSEGGPIVPIGSQLIATMADIAVPTDQSVGRVATATTLGTTTTVSLASSGGAPIQFLYTREDCRIDQAGDTVCNTENIKEAQVLTFTTIPSNPPGSNGSWRESSAASTYYIQNTTNGTWSAISGPTADYQPPGPQSCTSSGVTYASGLTWTTSAISQQSPTTAECPLGGGTQMDTMLTTTTYVCNDGLAGVQTPGTPEEIGTTGSCVQPGPPTGLCGVDNGLTSSSSPNGSNLCSSGNLASVVMKDPTTCSWSWSCTNSSNQAEECQAPVVKQSTVTVSGPTQLVIVLDASSSMDTLDAAAATAIGQLLPQFLIPNLSIHVVVLGGNNYNTTTGLTYQTNNRSCYYGTVFDSSNPGTNTASNDYGLSKLRASSYTPLASAISYAASKYLTPTTAHTAMLVMTDGAETCGGNLSSVVKAQEALGTKMFAIAYQDASYSSKNFTAFSTYVTANSATNIYTAIYNALTLSTIATCPN